MKVARLHAQMGQLHELLDVHLVWVNDNRMTLTGDEQVIGTGGKPIHYKQSWLCIVDANTAESVADSSRKLG